MAYWIDELRTPIDAAVGTVGFLSRSPRQGCEPRLMLDEHPRRTNMSHEPRLRGWCGETNNVSVHAMGMARVARIAKNGRVLVVAIDGAEQTAALDALGYPELDE